MHSVALGVVILVSASGCTSGCCALEVRPVALGLVFYSACSLRAIFSVRGCVVSHQVIG